MVAVLVVLAGLLGPAAALADRPAERSSPTAQATRCVLEGLKRGAVDSGLGLAPDLSAGNISRSTYSLTGQVLYHAKVTNLQSRETVLISVDAGGQVVDGELALHRELRARRETYGKLDPVLYDRLSDAPHECDETFPVSIWVQTEHSPLPEECPSWMRQLDYGQAEPTSEEVNSVLRAENQRVQALVAADTRPLLAYLKQQGVIADEIGIYVPTVSCALPKKMILEMEQREDVQLIGLVTQAQDSMDIAHQTVNANWVWPWGTIGWGERIGVVEVNGRAAVDNPYLRGIVQDKQNVCAEAKSHSTAVCGIVRSRHGFHRGIAYGARVRVGGACGGNLSQLQSAAERAIDWGATIINCSWVHHRNPGQPGADERTWDTLVYNNRTTICFSAGNTGRDDQFVGHPALAYNVLTVGAYDDHNTEPWRDDTMADFSSFKDPASANGDREKPELAAPGVSINSTSTRSPWTTNCGNGTSYASPITAGAAGLMMQTKTVLRVFPEAVKAILMATASNNIEYDWVMEGRDGAGGIDILEAINVTKNLHKQWGAGALTRDSFDADGNKYIRFDAPVADYARAVIVWCVDPNYSDYPSRPDADFDLYWLDTQGNEIVASESGDNNFEVVGVYDVSPAAPRTLRIHAYRINTDKPIRYGWAVEYW